MTKLTWWEHADLLDFLAHRAGWIGNDDLSLFLHTNGEGEPLLGLRIVPPTTTGPFRLYTVQAIPQAWSAEQTDEYFKWVLIKWTGFGMRLQFATLLMEELKLDQQTAMAMSIALGRIVSSPDGGIDEFPVQTPLPTFEGKTPKPKSDHPREKTYFLADRGYVKLALRGGQIVVELSLPSALSGGFGHPLKGFVRPKFGTNEDAIEALLGWDAIGRFQVDERVEQIKLKEAEDGVRDEAGREDSGSPGEGGAGTADQSRPADAPSVDGGPHEAGRG